MAAWPKPTSSRRVHYPRWPVIRGNLLQGPQCSQSGLLGRRMAFYLQRQPKGSSSTKAKPTPDRPKLIVYALSFIGIGIGIQATTGCTRACALYMYGYCFYAFYCDCYSKYVTCLLQISVTERIDD